MSARLQEVFARACFAKDLSFEKDLRGYLAKHGVPKEDVDAFLASPRRLGLYRKLIRHNVVNVIDAMLERTRARLDAKHPGVFDGAVDAFLDEVGPKTPHLRDVPAEFLAFAAPRWKKNERLPAWLVDFAELELVDFTIGIAPRPLPPPPLDEVSADRPMVFSEPRMLLRLSWAVHEEDKDPFEKRETTLLVYRDREHATRKMDLSPLAAKILERLFAGDALGPAIVSACADMGTTPDESILRGAAKLLADLGERGVLLGARA